VLVVIVLIATAVLATGSERATSAPFQTQVVRWSPLDAAGNVRRSLKVEAKTGSCSDIGYTYVGGIGYRCGWGNVLADACFRDGSNPTDYAICVTYPWDRRVVRLRSPYLLFYPGVTFTAAANYPWGIVLSDGNRCGVAQGAHDTVRARGRTYVVDYGCERGSLALMREGITRGAVWRVIAARWDKRTLKYTLLGHRPVRRVYFGTLPPTMARQNLLANRAYKTAAKIVRRLHPRAHPVADLAWVRMTLPHAEWAYVIMASPDELNKGWFVVLHRVDGKWLDVSADRPYCTKLPKRARQQLFLPKKTPGFSTETLAPPAETRC
jgi:hypothetical protein